MTDTDIKQLVRQLNDPATALLYVGEAAEALTSLSAENERMRGALAPFAAIAVHFDKEFSSTPLKDFHVVGVELKRCRKARAALGKDTPNA